MRFLAFVFSVLFSSALLASEPLTQNERAALLNHAALLRYRADLLERVVRACMPDFPDGYPTRRLPFTIQAEHLPSAISGKFPLVLRFDASAAAAFQASGPADGVGIRFADLAGNELPFDRLTHPNAAGAIYRVGITNPDPAATYYCYYDDATTTEWENRAGVWSDHLAAYDFSDLPSSGRITNVAGNPNYDIVSIVGLGDDKHVAGQVYKAWQFPGTGGVGAKQQVALSGYDVPFTLEWAGQISPIGNNKNSPTIQTDVFFNTRWAVSRKLPDGAFVFVPRVVAPSARFFPQSADVNTIITDAPHVFAMSVTVDELKFYQDGELSGVYAVNAGGGTTPTPPYPRFEISNFVAAIHSEIKLAPIARTPEWIAFSFANIREADAAITWGVEEVKPSTPIQNPQSSFYQGQSIRFASPGGGPRIAISTAPKRR